MKHLRGHEKYLRAKPLKWLACSDMILFSLFEAEYLIGEGVKKVTWR